MSEVGGPKQGLMNIGEEAKPPFAVLPDPSSLFSSRAKRLDALAPGHALEPYLRFLATIARAQHDMLPELPTPHLPDFARICQALEHGMPPLSRALQDVDDTLHVTVDTLLTRLSGADLPPATRNAISALQGKSHEERHALIVAAISDKPADDLAQRVLILAALQVHFARLAAQLDGDSLKPVADSACPTCGSGPMTSSVVGWPRAHNTRFCTCSLCATMWNVVRVKCVLCSSTGGISYSTIDGQPDAIKAETCDTCQSYVKILYQVNDAALDPFADDVASLGLDMLMAEEGWKRGGQNPFLLGY